MRPTDKDRREMAEDLRIMCEHGCRYKEQFYDLLDETVMTDWDFHDFQSVADRLADLIEPEPAPERTCHMDELNTGEPAVYEDTDEVIFHCMSCHAERGIFSYDEDGNVYSERPEYCPNCGAKVVDDGE